MVPAMSDTPDVPPIDNVVKLRTKRNPGDLPMVPVAKAPRDPDERSCFQHAFEYSRVARTVKCKLCGCAFEAFDALCYLSEHWERYDWAHRDVRREIAALDVEREKLKQQVKNLKAQARRATPRVVEKVREARDLFHAALRSISEDVRSNGASVSVSDGSREKVLRAGTLLGAVLAELEGREVSP